MTTEFVLQISKYSFEQIGRVRYSEIGMILESEQPRQVRFQASVSTSKAAVRVETFTRCRARGPLVQKLLPSLEPLLKTSGKSLLIGL